MEEIKVGDYVRSEIGSFGKVTRIEDNKFLYENKTLITFIRNVKKHSPNIIDLIEVGDYVNGKCVIATDNRINDNGEKVILIENYDEWTDDGVISNKDIKSIVTHEQFNFIKYEVI